MQTVRPYKDSTDSKSEQVERMFDRIAPTYDFLNSLLSVGIDHYWRKRAIRELAPVTDYLNILDVATGTGVLSFQTLKSYPKVQITGIDIADKMLDVGRLRSTKSGLDSNLKFLKADSLNLPFEANTFDRTMVAFGVRNFENLDKGLMEMYRVLKPGAKCVVLEFSKPRTWPIKPLFGFYFQNILPLIGRILSKDPAAYQYLFQSVQQFPDFDRFVHTMAQAGFKNCRFQSLTFGICCLYTGTK